MLCVTHNWRKIQLQEEVSPPKVKASSTLLRERISLVIVVLSKQVPNVLAFEHANLHGGEGSMMIEKQDVSKKTS